MIRAIVRAIVRAAILMLILAAPAAAQNFASGQVARLRGLDRVSGAITDIELAVGQRIRFGPLDLELVGCRYPADDPNSEAFAFLDIRDSRHDERLFYGWMIATAPALNALDHPRYDIWVLGCR